MTASPSQRFFVDLSAVRIHQYLGRSTSLRQIRGASSLLAWATSDSNLENFLEQGQDVTICTEAGTSESTIHLEVLATGTDAERPESVARRLVEWIRPLIPALPFRISWGSAATYSAFASATDKSSFESAPAEMELTFLEPCEECQRGYRSKSGRCVECDRREEFGSRRDSSGPANRLLDLLRQEKVRLPVDFDGLAGSVRALDDRKSNHLATIYADGNGFKSLFSKASDLAKEDFEGAPSFDVGALSRGISSAGWAALADATAAVQDGEILLVQPHLVAGEDLCVSTPAVTAWPFVLAYEAAFARYTRAAVLAAGNPSRFAGDSVLQHIPAPSISFGVVFAHKKEPFSRTIEIADEQLRIAKSAVQGSGSTVMWLDITRDGLEPPPWRKPLTLGGADFTGLINLDTVVATLNELVGLGQSVRRSLAADTANVQADLAWTLALDRCRRLGYLSPSNCPALSAWLTSQTGPRPLADMLSVVEWWVPA